MKYLTSILGLGLVAGGAWAYFQLREQSATEAVLAVQSRPTQAAAELRDISFSVQAAGEILPAEQVSVKPEVNGRIAELPVDLGDRVPKGALLFRLDDEDLKIERSAQLIEIERSQLELEQHARTLERTRRLYEAKLISLELFEEAKTRHDLAKNSLERNSKSLQLIEDRLSKTKIVAPFDCTVLTRPVSVGQAVSGSGGFNSGTEVLTIADLSALVIHAHVNQADVTRLSLRQEVEVSVESIPGLKLKGVVERLAPQASIKNGIKGYSARISLKQPDERVRPGMTAHIAIPIASAKNVLTIPITAVFSEMGRRFVFVQSEGKWFRRPVQIGISNYDFVEIRQGLRAGEIVSLEQITPAEEEAGAVSVSADAESTTAVTASGSSGATGAPAPATR